MNAYGNHTLADEDVRETVPDSPIVTVSIVALNGS